MASILQGAKLSYFGLPGRGESIRLALVLAGVEWTDTRVAFPEWGAMKASTPWGSMPVLELANGTQLAQQRSILRFVGKFGGLYPADPVLACRCDELLDVVDDIQSAINKVGADKPKEEKEAARIADATSGELAASMAKVEAYVGAHGSGGHAVGASLSVADLMISTTLSFVFSGFFDGVSESALTGYPNIQGVRKATMSDPRVAAWYAGRAEAATGFERFLAAAKDL